MTDLRAKLQQTLGAAYILERELGGGGMSRAFVAHETALGRTVVVGLIAPEKAQELSAERFAREVRLAARLQQANIVPLLAAGTAGRVPYYTMPFVKGESLRARLSNDVPLSFSDAVSILRDVARAGVRARRGSGASRHQAGERATVRRRCGGHRLRDRQGAERVAHGAGRGDHAHTGGSITRDAGLHGPGAGCGRSKR